MATEFNDYAQILGELWVGLEGDPRLADLFELNNLGFPLAYAHTNGLSTITDKGKVYITQTWERVLEEFFLDDVGYEGIDHFLEAAELE